MNKRQLRDLVSKVLIELGLYNEDAVELILGTIAQESAGGEYIRQINGPALGICQMEPETFDDICNNFLKYRKELQEKIKSVCGVHCFRATDLEFNIALAIAMCRVHYLRVKEKLPCDLSGRAMYWKKYYNTNLGKGTEKEFVDNFRRYVAI